MTSDPKHAEKEIRPEAPSGHMRLSKIEPLTDRCLSDRVAGKKVVFAFCDRQFEDASKLVAEMASFQVLPADMELMRWSELRSRLPFISADIVVVASLPPDELVRDPAGLASSLRHFRQRNPNSSLVMLSLYGTATPAGGVFRSLESQQLVDRVEPGPAQYDFLLRRGADLHELKTL